MSMMWCGAGVGVSYYSAKAQLVALKEFYPWFGEVNSQSLQYAVKQVADAFKNWWEHRASRPQPKCKKARQSFHNPQNCSVDWKHKTLSIPKCKDIPIVLHRSFFGKIKDVTISMNPDGRYYASILVDTAITEKSCSVVEEATAIGIDTGVKTFAVCSNGREFAAPHFAKPAEKRLKHYQRELRHKTKGSSGWKKIQHHIACIYAKVANQRLDFIHKVTHQLTHDSQVRTICIEDLNVKGMLKNHHLAYSIADASISRFYTILEYKCRWEGINLIRIGRWDASSRTCSACGEVNPRLKLSDRTWVCMSCGSVHDRDYNASVNIKSFGLRMALPSD
jgi:putative transposase